MEESIAYRSVFVCTHQSLFTFIAQSLNQERSGMPDEWKVTVTVTLKVGGATTRKEAEKAALERLFALMKSGADIPWDTTVVPLKEPRSDEPIFGIKWD